LKGEEAMKKMLAMALVLTAMTLGTANLMAGEGCSCGCQKGKTTECTCGKECKCGCHEGKQCNCAKDCKCGEKGKCNCGAKK